MIDVTHLGKTYRRGDGTPVEALKDISFLIERGEFVTIRGPSGSGKSSMLNIVGCLDKPTSGTYRLNGEELSGYSDKHLSHVRAWKIGFVLQSFHLMPRTTALENVEIPMIYGPGRVDRKRGRAALERVGLGERAHHYGTELSGGEQQRVAIARALVTRPRLLLADEPTGDLDNQTAEAVFELIARLHRDYRLTSLIATHNLAFARRCDRVFRLERKQLLEVTPASLMLD